MRRWLCVLAGGLVGLTACGNVSTIGLEPTYPIAGRIFKVATLRPPFIWEAAAEPGAQYDFIIYQAHEIDPSIGELAIGREVYYRQGLKEPHHELDAPLLPNRTYYWSVRVRRGDNVTGWSHFFLSGRDRDTEEYPFFVLKTPAK